jgi:hypothetical protein
MLEFIAFLVCLEFVVLNSAYHNNILKLREASSLFGKYLFNYSTLPGKITRLITLFKLRQELQFKHTDLHVLGSSASKQLCMAFELYCRNKL